MRFEVKKVDESWRVFDTKENKYITISCPKEVADEICEDFNKMENKDYSPLERDGIL